MFSLLFGADGPSSAAPISANAFFTAEHLLAVAAFAFIAVWTPGPNNVLLASSGARFGFQRTRPHALGVALGFPLMLAPVAFGLGELFKAAPAFQEALRWFGAALLLYLAVRIALAGKAEAEAGARPFTFTEAAAFQWVNPKAWVMCIGVASVFLSGQAPIIETATICAIFCAAGLTSSHAWSGFGSAIRAALDTDLKARLFNILMAVLLMSFVVSLFVD